MDRRIGATPTMLSAVAEYRKCERVRRSATGSTIAAENLAAESKGRAF
jgi:hypothetical protein